MTRIHKRVLPVFLACTVAALAQQARPTPTNPVGDVSKSLNDGVTPSVATVEKIMDIAVRNITIRYNLNENQTRWTSEMMRTGVYEFLRENEDDVWPVIRDLLASGMRAPLDEETMKRIGRDARPLLEKAQESILRYNMEWRELLSEEQKQVHDYDLSEMKETFRKVDDTFAEWSEGTRPEDPRLFPPVEPKGPARPRRPADSLVDRFRPERIFELNVERFIRENGLKEDQITAARSILTEFKLKAVEFRRTNKNALEKTMSEQNEALGARDMAAFKKADSQRRKLLQPMYALGDQMNDRLVLLLESAQLERYRARQREATRTEAKPAKSKAPEAEKTRTTSADKTEAG